MKEVWKIYPHNKNYSVSNFGKVRNDKTGKELKGWIKGSGYIINYIGLPHRMVMETFVGPYPKDKKFTNHIDGNKLNNRLDNLEYTNHTLNAIHAHSTGLIKQSKKVIVYKKNTNDFVGEYYSVGEAAYQLLGIRQTGNITKQLKGKIKSCYGYRFEYKN
ncbi:MAG: HNH endonuclease [Flavobacterium sp.]